MKYAWIITFVVLGLAVLGLSACGSKTNLAPPERAEDVTPPATPGSLEALVGTTWKFEKQNMMVRFGQPPSCQLINPANPKETGPAFWSLRPNGVFTMSFLGTTKAGCWDGQTVIVSGESGVRVQN